MIPQSRGGRIKRDDEEAGGRISRPASCCTG